MAVPLVALAFGASVWAADCICFEETCPLPDESSLLQVNAHPHVHTEAASLMSRGGLSARASRSGQGMVSVPHEIEELTASIAAELEIGNNSRCSFAEKAKGRASQLQAIEEFTASIAAELEMPGNNSRCPLDTLVAYVYHKTGVTLNGQVEQAVESFLAAAGCPASNYELRWTILKDPSKIEPVACFIHFERNPIEAVVSGYKYHLGSEDPCEEAITTWTLDMCDVLNFTTPVEPIQGVAKKWPIDHFTIQNSHLDILCGIWKDDTLSTLVTEGKVPHMFQNESLRMYLNRVDIESGLLVSAMWTLGTMEIAMETMHDKGEASSCATNVCLNDFDTQRTCAETFQRAFETTTDAQGDILSGMVRAATACCANGVIGEPSHASHNADHVGETFSERELPSKPDLVAKVVELDSKYLGGELALMAAKIGCAFSDGYQRKM